MEIPQILAKMEEMLTESNPESIYSMGNKRAYASAYMFELEHLRKSNLAIITKEFSKEMAHNKAEAEARASEEHRAFLAKLSKAKLDEELAVNRHRQALNMYSFLEKKISCLQSSMKLR